MQFCISRRMLTLLAAPLLALAAILSVLTAQEHQAEPALSPSPTPTVTPNRTPSPTPLPGAQNFHRWGSITVFNGLPSDSIKAIAQTPDGVMWFGTDNGLARFDGRHVQNFTLGEGDSNRILVMKTESNGRIWLGTQKGAFIFSSGQAGLIAGTENIGIQSLLLGDENYLGSDSGAVYRVSESNGDILSAQTISQEQLRGADAKPLAITGLVKDGDRLLVATYGRGIFIYRDGKYSVLASNPRPTFINSLSVDGSGKIWLGTDANKGISGIFRLDDQKAVRIAAPTANVWPIGLDEKGIWAGTARYGLFHLVNGKTDESFTFENTSGGLRSNTVFSIFTDREGVVWFGTNRGASRYDPSGALQKSISDIPNRNFVRTFFESGDGRALFAGTNRGLLSFNGKDWEPIPSFEDTIIYAIGQSGKNLLIGTPSGAFDERHKLVENGDVRSLADFDGDAYAAVVDRGVIDLDNHKVIFNDGLARSLFAGTDRLWIGTAGHGLFSFDGQDVRQEITPDVLKSGTILNISQDADRAIWIAGEHGVFVIRSGSVEHVIAAEDVRDVAFDGTYVWAATTTRGLLHARHYDRLGWISSAIGFEQGLPSEKAFSIVLRRDGVEVATNRGIVEYTPATTAPKLLVERVLSQRVHSPDELHSNIALDYPQNSILVEVAGLSSRTFPEEFQYAFTLRDSRDQTVDQRFSNDAQYNPTNLKPGEYSIESVAFDRDLNASEPLVIKFSIAKAPFPWTATALGILLAIAIVGLVWAVFEHRRMRQRNRELAAARFDLANEAERERSRIARDLHDQTLADLRNLLLKSDKGALSAPELRGEIESVSTEIRRICEDLSPSVLENVGLIPALEFLLSQTIENHKFSAEHGVEEKIEFPVNIQLQIYRIAQEVLTNIRRHSDAGEVAMNVEMPEAGLFKLTITDDGAAFQPDGAGRGRGIANIRSRAGLINARASWKNGSEGGNVFSLAVKR